MGEGTLLNFFVGDCPASLSSRLFRATRLSSSEWKSVSPWMPRPKQSERDSSAEYKLAFAAYFEGHITGATAEPDSPGRF